MCAEPGNPGTTPPGHAPGVSRPSSVPPAGLSRMRAFAVSGCVFTSVCVSFCHVFCLCASVSVRPSVQLFVRPFIRVQLSESPKVRTSVCPPVHYVRASRVVGLISLPSVRPGVCSSNCPCNRAALYVLPVHSYIPVHQPLPTNQGEWAEGVKTTYYANSEKVLKCVVKRCVLSSSSFGCS